jgi:signal transduction histidine kinase
MRPDDFRNDRRFLGCSSAVPGAVSGAASGIVLALLAPGPAFAASPGSDVVIANAPLAIACGAAAFAVLAALAVKRLVRDARVERAEANEQIAGLRAELDEYEALLSSGREVTVLWSEPGGTPRILGPATSLLPPGRRPAAILDFGLWLAPADARRLASAVEALRVAGEAFELTLSGRADMPVRVAGAPAGSGAAIRLRPLLSETQAAASADSGVDLRMMLAALDFPAFLRDAGRQLVFANPAYHSLADQLGRKGQPGRPPELLDGPVRDRHLGAVLMGDGIARLPLTLPAGDFELAEFRLGEGSVGYLQPRPAAAPEAAPSAQTGDRAAALVAALGLPVAIFDAEHYLVAFNAAYATLWNLADWLRPGLDERAVLDRLRRDGQLPSEPDYQGWRARHMQSYGLRTRRTEPWHLPDGRMLNVTAAPAGDGGVIYLFEDVSRELELVSQNRALASVQRSTLNALSDAVAVFGTNGRLQLFNPRLSALWKLPTNFLDQHPHIDQVAAAAAAEFPEDGAEIWRELKRAVIDLSPTRADTTGRLTRSDGRLVDYALVRLPDGQKLLTFLDVTESADYNRVLKERNEALVTADRLKDAFVQNVSYELRSPLTNIIGFADLLASPEIGPLNERQRSYTDYIRSSSVTLGVLVDNILDLATVDAGIAELRPAPQDVATLVEKARAGLAATFPQDGGGTSVNLKIAIAPNLPTFIADGTRLVQVLYNLLSTAARFSAPGGEVRLSVAPRGQRMLFTVEDDGTAMSEEMRAALAERADGGVPVGRDRAAGLGLSIVRAFVSLHGGTISVDQRPGGGSRVVVSLPLDAAAAIGTAAAE